MTFFLIGLAGLPPTIGFTGKILILAATVGAGYAWLARRPDRRAPRSRRTSTSRSCGRCSRASIRRTCATSVPRNVLPWIAVGVCAAATFALGHRPAHAVERSAARQVIARARGARRRRSVRRRARAAFRRARRRRRPHARRGDRGNVARAARGAARRRAPGEVVLIAEDERGEPRRFRLRGDAARLLHRRSVRARLGDRGRAQRRRRRRGADGRGRTLGARARLPHDDAQRRRRERRRRSASTSAAATRSATATTSSGCSSLRAERVERRDHALGADRQQAGIDTVRVRVAGRAVPQHAMIRTRRRSPRGRAGSGRTARPTAGGTRSRDARAPVSPQHDAPGARDERGELAHVRAPANT